MNDNIKLLSELSVAANTGINALNTVIPEVKNHRMKNKLNAQLNAYKDFASRTGIPKKGGMAYSLSKLTIKIQTKLNPSPSHLAQMMMQGTEMGLIKTQKAINHNRRASDYAKNLAYDMLEFEQNSIDDFRSFL